ncbi:hypothetical protein ACFWP7_35475 [Streptomyces sp. NPDC058470]|uniref:hypothetical protein n=1 Tax=Streptomyces sp. NPDC058470 TaxID=3346515 RepID=UPI0036625552
MATFEEQIDSIGVEPITAGVVLSFTSTLRESESNPRAGRPRVKNASVFVAHDELRAICEALAQGEDYRSPGDKDAFRGFLIEPWDEDPDVRGSFQFFASGSVLEVDLSERTQSELLGRLQQALEKTESETHIRFYDHRGVSLN